MPLHVLEEDPFRAALPDDAGDLRPEVARVLCASPLSGDAERLTGIAGRDDMNAPAPRAAVEGSQIVPDNSWSQGLVDHPGHESGRGVGLPLDETHSSIGWLSDVQAEIEAGVAGAQRESAEVSGLGLVEGTNSHKAGSFRPLCRRSVGGSWASGC
jgi:hypothetical protein